MKDWNDLWWLVCLFNSPKPTVLPWVSKRLLLYSVPVSSPHSQIIPRHSKERMKINAFWAPLHGILLLVGEKYWLHHEKPKKRRYDRNIALNEGDFCSPFAMNFKWINCAVQVFFLYPQNVPVSDPKPWFLSAETLFLPNAHRRITTPSRKSSFRG